MTKKINKGSIAKYLIFLGIFITLAFSLVLSFKVMPSGEPAFAAAPSYKGYFAEDNSVYFNPLSTNYVNEEIFNSSTGSFETREYYKIPFLNGATKWNDAIVNDLMLKLTFKYQSDIVYSSIFNVMLRNTAGANNTIYAYAEGFNITGTTWEGTSYNGTAAALTVAGVYHINSIVVNYYVGAKCDTHNDLLNSSEPITGTPAATPYNTGSITLSSNFDVVVTADLIIDETQSAAIGINNNLNISPDKRTYGSSANFREIVKIHSTVVSDDNSFSTYSSKRGGSGINISNNDFKFFKPFVDVGLGSYPEQTTGLENPGGYPNTTLIGISPLLTIQWNTGSFSGVNGDILSLTEITSGTSISNAGVYYLRIVPVFGLVNGFQTVSVKLSGSGKEYIQKFEILKKQLNIDLVGAIPSEPQKIGITVNTTKGYDKTASATGLFSNQSITSVKQVVNDVEIEVGNWVVMGGIGKDYTALSEVLINAALFDFAGTVFDSAEIGNRTVKFYINLLRLSPGNNNYGPEETITKLLNNYEPVAGRMVSGNFTPYATATDTNGYKYYNIVGITFKIVQPTITISFNSALFSGSFDYGQYLFPTEFSYQRFTSGIYYNSINATNTTMNEATGKIGINNFDNWQIAFLGDSSLMKTDATKNIVYVIPKVGKKILPGDVQNTKVYTDKNGQGYYAYSGRLYANNDYYFYFDVYAYFSTGNSSKITQQANGGFNIPKAFESSEVTATIATDSLLNLIILKREVLITVSECNVNKAYDGTKDLKKFVASASNIIAGDAVMVELGYEAMYSTAGAGEKIPININYYLKATQAYLGQDLDNLIGSYTINTNNYINNSGVPDITKGTITPLNLNIKFVKTSYTKKFNEPLFVVVRVAKAGDAKFSGAILQKDLLYYYAGTVGVPYSGLQGFCTEEELASIGIKNYVIVEISGFKTGEGFLWDETNLTLKSFMMNMTYSTPVDSVLNSSQLLSWYDSLKGVEINKTTNANASLEDTYRLEFSSEAGIAPNYNFVPTAPMYGYLHIEKLAPEADVIVVEGENAENYLQYIGSSNITKIFETGKVKYTNHKEYLEITQLPSQLLSVIDFTFSCENVAHDHSIFNLSSPLVQNLTYSGIYMLRLSLPSTTNYLPTSMDFEIVIHTKIVKVYLTKAVRIYGESEVVFDTNNPKYITDINQYRYMIDSDGNIVEENGNVVYIYKENGNIVEGNYVMYQGLINGDYFGSDQAVDNLATVNINPGTTNAGIFINAITVSNACKHNYSFSYYPTTLYVLRKELTIQAEPVQSKVYTGDEVYPNYQILGGTGNLAMYKIGKVVNGVEIFDPIVDETDTSIVDVGIYIIKVFARPRVEDEGNYKVSDIRLTIILTILEQKVILISENNIASKTYDEINFQLEKFNYYFKGVTSPAKYSWGYVYISQATVNGVPVLQAKNIGGELLYLLDDYGERIKDYLGGDIPLWDIKNSGMYTLDVTAIITNKTNTYFSEGESDKVYKYYFTITLNVEKSSEMFFTTITSEGTYTVKASLNYDETYNQIYNGKEATFNYSLFASGKDCSAGQIPVTFALDGTLYSYNNNIYNVSAPLYNTNAALNIPGKIDNIAYNITNRNKLLNVGTYELKVFVNNESSENYNSNYASIEYIYEVVIIPAKLKVYIEFEEGYGSYKVYGEDNASIEQHVIYRYVGWIANEENDIYILAQIIPPTIDWSDVGNNAVAGDDYRISSIGGTSPSNYQFDHTSSFKNFVVKKADSWIIVFGFYDVDNARYTDYNSFSGLNQQPNVLRMAGNNPINTEIESVGEAGIKIVFEGLFIGKNKSKILPKDIDASVNNCYDTGKYVFSISVIASTNYKAVEKAYYYYEIVKAELEMVFVVQEFDGENYTVTEVRGYSSKIYDGDDTSYPAFTVRYNGFVGADNDINSYKNVMQVAHIGDLVYVIVGESTYQTFAKNFVSVQDGQGKYILDKQGNYIMLNTSGNYIKDIKGNYISVTSIKCNYYKDGEEYKLINGTHVKDVSNNYLQGTTIVGNYILDENNEYVLVSNVVGKYATDGLGNYIKTSDTFMLTENNAYVNIKSLIGVYYKDESGTFIKGHEAIGKYFKNYSGAYINITLALGNYNKNVNDEYVLVAEGTGDYVRNEDGEYVLVTALVGKYVKNFEGQYLAVENLQGNYVKDKDGRFYKLSELTICPFISNGSGGYVRVNYLLDSQDKAILFFKDFLGNYIDCSNIIGTHIKDEFSNFIKVRTYLGNLVSFNLPYVKTLGGDFVAFNTLNANYVRDISGNYYPINGVVAEYIRNSVGDYLKVSTILGQSITDENGDKFIVKLNDAKYFCDESGNFLTLNKVTAKYIKTFGDQYIRLVGDYVRLENLDFVNISNLKYNYIKDLQGNYIKIKDESGNMLNGVMGNYIATSGGLYTLVALGTGTHILDENNVYVRVNGNYNLNYDGIKALSLVNPVYEIFNNGGAYLPTDVDTYKVRVVLGETFGLAKNYNINIDYKQIEEEIAYPELEIIKRPIDITYSENMVTKVYDGYSRIPEGSVTGDNYIYLKTVQGGVTVAESGPIAGDIINLRFDTSLSSFMRKDVFDSNGEATQNYVKIYGYSIDNPNYLLQVSQKYSDDNGTYLQLLARITPASAIIRFIDQNGKNITNKLEVVYNAENHPINAIVQGVKLDDSSYEVISYTINYNCESNNYDSDQPPKNAESYIVSLTISEKNYVSTRKLVDLVIQKATVSIVFGGDIVQTFGSIVGGLTAEARGVGGYLQTLQVLYYDSNGNNIADITKANAGIYEARAIHGESTNFKQSILEEDFIINRRNISLYYDLSTTYAYTGKEVAPKIYFMYEGIKYEPQLKFNYRSPTGSQNAYVPYNYGNETITTYPINVGAYQLQANNNLQNFNIIDSYWTDFNITPVNLTVSIADLTVLTDKTISFNYLLDGAVNSEGTNNVFTKMPSIRYYSSNDNMLLTETPTTAGIYKVEPYGGESINYNITYKYGMLSINNARLLAGSKIDEKQQVIVEGSFAANVTLNIREITNTNFSRYLTSFDAFKASNAEYAKYNVIKMYYLSLSDGSVSGSDNSELLIRLYVPELFDNALVSANASSNINAGKAEDGVYYVAHIDSQGIISILQAYRDGDYLCFNSSTLEVYCILSTEELKADSSDDWILYLSISLGIAFIAVALIIVRKRA